MNFVLADYAPSTQRKDKFKLDMRVTKGQAKQMESNPFFSLYLNKYGKIVMPVFLLSKIFNAMVPRLAKYKLIRQADQAKLWGKSTAATLTIEKQSDGFVLQWTLNEVTKLQPFLRLLYQISDNEFLTKTDELGNQIPPLDAEVKRILDINYSAGLAGTKLRLDTDAIARFMTKDVEKLSFSCIRELVIEIDQLYGITTRITAFMTAKEAELLTRLQYLAIRNIDIFPIVLHWLASGYAKGPTTSVSLSRVSANIDPQSIRYAKTNEHNLCLNQDGQIWYIPREVNKSRDYESLYTRYCTSDNPDNKKFGLMVRGEGEAKTKLPANMPILVDWTNAKFSYSTGMGGQAILDLSRCRPLTATHVRNVFRRLPLDPQLISTWYKYAEYLGVPRSELLTKIGDSAASYSVMDMIFAASRGLPEGEFLSFYELLGDDEFKPAVDILTKIASVLEQKSEQFMNQYSVFTWVNTLGLLKSIAVYAPDWAKYSEEDKANRSASINQAITPGWQLPSVPFFNNAPGLMPHQVRVMNMMKDDPKFCLLPVAAGGGKTICAIMDILKQYSQGKNAPYMVLCPNMLVSQYVQEVAFFTKGRLNAIPITTAVVRRNGLDRLQKIFDAAPRNTVVIVSYNAIVYNSHKIAYGTNTVTRFPIVEFLRQFQFGYALCDESHQLKSEKSIKARAVNILLSDIPMIRLASGTLAYNRINDIVGQASIMDPSLFGTQADFENTYGKFVKGKYAGLKHGMEAVINSRLKDDMVIAGAQRKEWAALLPQTETNYYMVNLSPQEQEIYQKVLDIASEHLEDTPELKKAMEELEKLKAQQKVEFSQERQDLIDEREERLTSRITPYLQKLERLIIDPLKESAMMTEIPADYVSEKVRKVIELVEHHIEGWDEMKKDEQGNPTGEFIHHPPTPGKVIIFTENLASAQSIFDAFAKVGSSVAENGLLYSTTNKHELLDKFNTDPNIKWMVGVETSINTGLNLQAASRIIRAEYPWQPGALEQGNARILRPLLKSKDGRTTVYFDWVVCDGTIDTLKVSRLMAKSAEIAKFEHPSDTRYQNIGISHDPITNQRVFTIPVIGVTMKSIRAGLRFVNPDRTEGELYDYFKAMKTLHGIEKEDYQTYRLQHPEEINADGTMKSVPVTVEQNPKDAKILRYIPYVEGTNLYNSDQLGLQRLDEYLNRVSQSLSDDDEDEGGDLSEDTTDADDAFLEHLEQLKGETVYCEYGECQIYSISATKPNCVVIPVHSVQRIRVPLSSVFLITKKVVKPQVLYKALAKEVGINTVVEPEYVRPAGAKETSKGLKKLRKQQEEEQPVIENSAELQINLKPMLINGLLGFRFIDLEGHDLGINILEQNGFRLAPEYYRAQIKNLRMLEQWLTRMTEMGLKFKAPYDYSGSWKQIAGLMRRRQARYNDDDMEYKANTAVVTKVVSKGQLQNILRWDVKPTNRTDVLRVQPMFSNGVVFAIMPSNRLYSIGNKIRRKRVPGMKWERGPEAYERYFARKDEALNCLKQLQESGLTITNLKQLMQTIQRARTAKFDDIDSIKQKVNRTRRTRKSKWDLSLDLPEDGEITIIDDRKDRRKRSSRRKSPWDIKVDLPQRNIRIKNDVPLTLRSPRRKWYS